MSMCRFINLEALHTSADFESRTGVSWHSIVGDVLDILEMLYTL